MTDNYSLANLRKEHHTACCYQVTGGLEPCDCQVAWLRDAYIDGWVAGEVEFPNRGQTTEQEMNLLSVEAYEMWRDD